MAMEKRLLAPSGLRPSGGSFGGPGEDDEVGKAVEEAMDDATQALVALLQREKRRALTRVAITAAGQGKGSYQPLPELPEGGDEEDAVCALPDTRSSIGQLINGLPSQWTPPISYRPGLQDILSHPVTLELFKDSLQAQHCVENVLFLARVQRWMDASTQRQHSLVRALLAEQIARDFIQDDAPYQINLDHTSREALLRKVKEGHLPLSLFSGADGEVRRLLEVNSWPQFTQSSSYTFCIHLLWRNVAIMKAMQEQLLKDGGGAKAEGGGKAEPSRGSVEGKGEGRVDSVSKQHVASV